MSGKAKVKELAWPGHIVQEYPPRGNLQLFLLDMSATFVCSVRNKSITAKKVAVNLETGELMSNGGYGQLLSAEKKKNICAPGRWS